MISNLAKYFPGVWDMNKPKRQGMRGYFAPASRFACKHYFAKGKITPHKKLNGCGQTPRKTSTTIEEGRLKK